MADLVTIYPIPAGPQGPGLQSRGVYNPATADYIKGDWVSYGTGIWAAIRSVPAGVAPVAGPYWTFMFDIGVETTPALDYSTQSETRAGDPETLKPVKPSEANDLVIYLLNQPAVLIAALNAATPSLPTSLPGQAGKVWNNGGVISIS